MEWQIVVALAVVVPVLILPVVSVWYLTFRELRWPSRKTAVAQRVDSAGLPARQRLLNREPG